MQRNASVLCAILLTSVFFVAAHGDPTPSLSYVLGATCNTATYTAGSSRPDTQTTGGLKCVGGVLVLGAGSAVVGKVGIDQTTPGTTNGVVTNNGSVTTAAQGAAAGVAAGWPTINGEPADATGTFTNATQTGNVTTASVDGYGTALITINGTYGTATATFLASDDGGSSYPYAIACSRTDGSAGSETGYTSLTNVSRAWICPTQGFDSIRVLSSAVASGTVNVRVSQTAAPTTAATLAGINLSQLNGATIATGAGASNAQTQRVTTSSDSTIGVEGADGSTQASASNPLPVSGAAANGAAVAGNPNLIGGSDGTNVRSLLVDTSGRTRAVGAGASGAAAVGDPVGVGCKYNATTPTFTDGQRGDCQIGPRGSLAVEESGRTFCHIATATTTTCKSGAGNLHTLCINTDAASATITAYDNTAGSGTVMLIITNPLTLLSMGPLCANYDLSFSTGLTIVTTGVQDITATYR